MMTLLGILAASGSVVISFSDKIIEDYMPNSSLSEYSEQTDEVVQELDNYEEMHQA